MSNLLQKKNSIFQQEYLRYLVKINSMADGQFKQEMKTLLENLVITVKKLDNMHMELIHNRQMPSIGSNIRHDIMAIRKKLDHKLRNVT